ncbi:Clas44 [Clostera anastomosis granulovirus B]|uniref:Clas44 n=1 Tax=Clostera anastomosis granulovirus B TaxID=1986290 RepID=A0A0K0WSF3_9BBAC|nr:Clas44 [Clostera anastomosis granulovirus B]AKS25387.1 Clas44 [Clostera anastomosis granulovirus B]
MDNFDQLDVIIKNNQVLIQQVVLFIVSVTLIFIACSLLYVVYNYNKKNSLIKQW